MRHRQRNWPKPPSDSNAEVTITVGGRYRGEYQTERYCHPVEYLFKSDDELKEIKRSFDEKIAAEERAWQEKKEAEEKARRKKEYLKLKKEFEGKELKDNLEN